MPEAHSLLLFFLTHVLLAATRVDVDFIITAFSSRRASVSAIYLSSGGTSASHFHRRRSLFWSVNEQCVEFSETLGFKKNGPTFGTFHDPEET